MHCPKCDYELPEGKRYSVFISGDLIEPLDELIKNLKLTRSAVIQAALREMLVRKSLIGRIK